MKHYIVNILNTLNVISIQFSHSNERMARVNFKANRYRQILNVLYYSTFRLKIMSSEEDSHCLFVLRLYLFISLEWIVFLFFYLCNFAF